MENSNEIFPESLKDKEFEQALKHKTIKTKNPMVNNNLTFLIFLPIIISLYPSFRLFVVFVSYGGEIGFGAVLDLDFTTLLFYFINGKLVVVLDEPVVIVGPGFKGLFHGLVLPFDRLRFQAFNNWDFFFGDYKNKNEAADQKQIRV